MSSRSVISIDLIPFILSYFFFVQLFLLKIFRAKGTSKTEKKKILGRNSRSFLSVKTKSRRRKKNPSFRIINLRKNRNYFSSKMTLHRFFFLTNRYFDSGSELCHHPHFLRLLQNKENIDMNSNVFSVIYLRKIIEFFLMKMTWPRPTFSMFFSRILNGLTRREISKEFCKAYIILKNHSTVLSIKNLIITVYRLVSVYFLVRVRFFFLVEFVKKKV